MGCHWLCDMTHVAYFNPIFIFFRSHKTQGHYGDQCRATNHLRNRGAQGFFFKAVLNLMVKSCTQKIQSFGQLLRASNHSDLFWVYWWVYNWFICNALCFCSSWFHLGDYPNSLHFVFGNIVSFHNADLKFNYKTSNVSDKEVNFLFEISPAHPELQ